MSIAKTADISPAIHAATRGNGRTTLVAAQLITGLLLVGAGIWLIVLFESGFNGGGILVAMGAAEIALGVLSLVALPGLRSGSRRGWVGPLSVIGAAYNGASILFAATATLTIQYPGGAVVLLILFNDVILGELVVLYLLNKPAD